MRIPLFSLLALCSSAIAATNSMALADAKPNLIVTTDIGGDPDDYQAMTRLMLYSNEFNILGLIASSAGVPGQLSTAVIKPEQIREVVTNYGLVRDNLLKHASGYPPAEDLIDLVADGNPNRGLDYVGEVLDQDGNNILATQGAKLIVSQVDQTDGLVNIVIWGGATDVAEAFYLVLNDDARSSQEKAAWVAKVHIYSILDQDGYNTTLAWIRNHAPDIWMLEMGPGSISGFDCMGRGMYQNDSLRYNGNATQLVRSNDIPLNQEQWVKDHVHLAGNALGLKYPVTIQNPPSGSHNTNGVKEGDTPSWFYFLRNGLSSAARPEWGGWGGRFLQSSTNLYSQYYTDQNVFDKHWSGTSDGATRRKWSVARWRVAYQNEFQARMMWSNTDQYSLGNHNPIAVLNGDNTTDVLMITATPDSTVTLSAAGSDDPDGDNVRYLWWQYEEVSSGAAVTISGDDTEIASFTVPSEALNGDTFHIILEVTDDGTPNLTSYRRAIITVDGATQAHPAPAISNLTVASGKTYQIVDAGLAVGSVQYTDRTYTFTGVPGYLRGATYIKTANDDKQATGSPFLTFDIDGPATVYMAYDDRLPRPTWMADFLDTGDNLSTSAPFSLLAKNFDAGTVSLGDNGTTSSASSMYSVVIVGISEAPPLAQPDDYDAMQGATLNVPAPGVLGNDTDANNAPLSAVLIQDTTHGTLQLNADGSFNYTPDSGVIALDSFQYYATNGERDSEPVTVTISILTNTIQASLFGTTGDFTPADYDAGQIDNATYRILGGRSLEITGNGWLMLDLGSVTIGTDTVLAFDFTNPVEGDIHGIGFDTDTNYSVDKAFQFSGSQDWAPQNFDDYGPFAPGVKHYEINVGQYYTGTFRYLFFVHEDNTARSAVASYANIRVYTPTAQSRWAESMGLDFFSNAGPQDDANGDGKSNAFHFALATNPLGNGSNEGKRASSVEDEDGNAYLTITAPFRLGAVFSGTPSASAPVDGIIYTLYGDSDLGAPFGDIPVVEVVPAKDSGLPVLDDLDATSGPDWEYRTFRLTSPLGTETSGFLWIEVQEAL